MIPTPNVDYSEQPGVETKISPELKQSKELFWWKYVVSDICETSNSIQEVQLE